MNLLKRVWELSRVPLRVCWETVLDAGWSVWHEVVDGANRASWWLLVGLVWLDGLLVGWWLLG